MPRMNDEAQPPAPGSHGYEYWQGQIVERLDGILREFKGLTRTVNDQGKALTQHNTRIDRLEQASKQRSGAWDAWLRYLGIWGLGTVTAGLILRALGKG